MKEMVEMRADLRAPLKTPPVMGHAHHKQYFRAESLERPPDFLHSLPEILAAMNTYLVRSLS